jgi:pSer/pThr/pTyr-binding forkhead associated (FHA) protein
VIRCPVCRSAYVPNTLFCTECGLYLLESEELGTDPLEMVQVKWLGGSDPATNPPASVLDTGPLTIRLRINQGDRLRELEVPVTKPIRMGRMDPLQDIYPEVDLTPDLAMEHGVSREHACIFRRGDIVVVEDLGSTNGTLLNSKRLAPFLPQPLEDGDQLQLGKLLIEVCFKTYQHPESTPQPFPSQADGH